MLTPLPPVRGHITPADLPTRFASCEAAKPPRFATFEISPDAAKVDLEKRTIGGLLVPFGEVGIADVDGKPTKIRYRQGATVEAERARTPIVNSHDTDSPLGVLVWLETVARGKWATFKIDATPAGDVALEQAASGSRSGLSVAGPLTEYEEIGDVLEVAASTIRHVGLVTVPAFESAEVTSVAAAQSQDKEGKTMDPKELREALGLPEDASDDDVKAALASCKAKLAEDDGQGDGEGDGEKDSEQEKPVRHGHKPVILASDRRSSKLKPGDAGRLVLAMMHAQAGDREAHKLVQAALSEVASVDVPGLMPVAHTNEILGGLEQVDRPLHDAFMSKPMPDSGMKISNPTWTTKPLGGWVAELADTPSNKPEIDLGEDDILEWAYGVALSYAVATRSSPDAIETIFSAAVEDYYNDYEQKIADLLMANDQAGAAGAGVGSAIALFFGDERYRPRLLVVAPDIYGDLIDEEGTLKYSSGTIGGSVDNSDSAGSIAGLSVVVSANLPAGAELVTHPRAVIHRESSPVRLTANVIGALKVELGVTAFAAFQLNRPNAIHSLTPPAGAPAGQSEAKRTATRRKDKGK